jgi:hypothetical protein
MRPEREEGFPARRRELARVADAARGQRRRVAADLARIYPIEPLPGGPPLAFTIAGAYLPNGLGDGESSSSALGEHAPPPPPRDGDGGGGGAGAVVAGEATVAAALGHAAHLTAMLAAYTGAHLPYPLAARGSRSTVADPISASAAGGSARVYPLFSRGAPRYQFEYAAFLLSKDVELLCGAATAAMMTGGGGLRVVDARHTLPNLKVVVCAVAAGRGEVPVRTKGELRAFLRGVVEAEREGGEGRANGEVRRGKRVAVSSG